jgi:hypothetical protein
MLDEESLPLNMLRVTSLLGSFISESRSRPGATERPYNLFVITTPPDQGKDILLQYATTIPSLKTFPIIVSTNDDKGNSESDSIETTAIAISSRISKFAHVDGLYMNLNGREQSICSLLQSKKVLQRIGFIATHFNKTALDRHGPLPATEFIARSFGDNGVTTVTAGGGSRFMHDGLLSVFLSNVPSVKLIMRSAIYLPRTTSSAVVQRKTVSSTNMEESIVIIPCIVHFVFGMSDDEKDRFFNMQQYLAVKAAHDFLQPETIYVHYTYEPLGSWWELAKDFVTPNKVRNVVNIFNHSVHHFAHKADIIRLEVLLQYGGVYFDLGVWVYRDIRFLLTSGHEFIMGQEGENGAVGLCNAIIISHKDSKFLKMWYDAYQHFSEKSWNEFSVQLPNRMAAQHPSWVHVLPHTAFFWPMWDSNGLTRLYLSQDCPWFQMGYAVHLWSSKARSMIDELGTQSLYQYDSCFFQLARKIYYGNGDQKQQLSSSSFFLKGSHDLSEETSNQKKGTEMSEIVVGVLVFSLEELETARKSWMTAALEFGIKCYFYTPSASVAEQYSALIKMGKSRDEVPLTVLKPQFAPSPDPTSREWVSSHMLAHLFDNNKGKGMKWFVKVEADTFLRPASEDDEDAHNPVTRMIYKAFSASRIEITSTACQQPQQSPFGDLLEESDPALNLFRVTSLLGSFVSEWRSRSSGSSSYQRAFNFVVITSSTNTKASQKGENTLLRYAARIPSVKTIRITVYGKNNELESLETLSAAITSQLNGIDSIDGMSLSLSGKEQAITSILLSQNILQKIGFIVTDFNKTVLDLSGPLPATEYIVRSFGDIGVTTVSGGRGERFMHDGLLSSHLANSEPMQQLIMRSTTYFPAAEQSRETRFNRKKKPTAIPCIVHFVFGMSDDEKDRFFNMQQYLAVKAAHDFLQPETIYVHYTYDPSGSWWELAKDFVTPNKVRNVVNIFNHSVHHFAHKADIIRLEVLMQYGGIYLDLDVWVYRDLRFLLTSGHEFIMGQEGENGAVGLCNAIIIADKESRFLKHWYNVYRNFSADSWNEFSVQLPNRIAAELPAWIHVLPHTAFFWPMWDSNGLTRLYLSQDCPWFQMGYAVHLWSSKARSMIDELGTQSLYQYDSCFFQLARKIYYGKEARNQQLSSSSSSFLKGSHDLSEETDNQVKRTEMSEIVVGVLVFSLEELETVRKSWMTAALEFGIRCSFYTSSVIIAEEYSALNKMRKSRDEVPLTVLKPKFGLLSDPTTREWVSSHMFAHLFDNNQGKGMKWFVKVEADTFLRPDALRNTLSQYDSNEPTYLGSVTEFHGHRQASNQSRTGEYIRLRYAQGHFYALSSSAMQGIRPKLIECNSDLWEEDKALAHCLRKYLDLQPIDVSSSSVPIHVIPVSDRSHQLAYHGMDGEAMVSLARNLYGSQSVVVPALSEAGFHDLNINTENTKVQSVSFLSDPNDFRRHDVLYNRGAVLSYWLDQCFASGEICGWKEITRTDCLAIGCCYKDEFSALFSPCMKAEGGTFQTENQLRATMITTATAALLLLRVEP